MTAIVDSHVHLWDPAVHEYPWLADEESLLRPFLPSDLDAGGHQLDAVVVVEAGCHPDQAMAELRWIERLAGDWAVIRAMVVQVPLERGDAVEPVVAELADHPLVAGVRRNVQDEPAGFMTRPAFVAGVRLLGAAGLTFDACVRDHQLPELIELADLCPGVAFVLDHLGKPAIRTGGWASWQRDLAELATRAHVYAKLSGLTTEADRDHWQPSDIRRYLDHALTVFGPDRCMFGSDWPVATLATQYADWLDVVAGALAGPAREHWDAAVLGATAARVYRLDRTRPAIGLLSRPRSLESRGQTSD